MLREWLSVLWQIDALVQGERNSIALLMDLRLWCINPSIWYPHSRYYAATPGNVLELISDSWWHHEMETFTVLPALCEDNQTATVAFPVQRASDMVLQCIVNLTVEWPVTSDAMTPMLRHRNKVAPSETRIQIVICKTRQKGRQWLLTQDQLA